MTRSRLLAPAGALLGLLVAYPPARADEPAAAAPAEVMVGPLDGAVGSARIGLVANDTRFLAYVCSQDEAFNSACSRWTTGPVKDGKFEGKSADGKVAIRGGIQDGTARGTVTAGDREMTFQAKRVADPLATGLFRAEEKDGEDVVVAGWVVDDDGTVAGAIQNRRNGQVRTPPPPKTGKGQAPQTPVTPSGRAGQPVTDPANPPAGRGAKRFTPAVLQDKQAELQANVAGAGGSPLLGLTVQQVRRFLNGARAGSPLEEQTFAKLARANRQTLASYIKRWDAIPVATRRSLIGANAAQVSATQPLTAEQAGAALRTSRPSGQAAPKAGTAQVRSVRVTQLRCVNRTDPLSADEVFATYLVLAGDVAADKTTQVVTGLRNGDTRTFPAADVGVFPPAGSTQPATQDIFLAAGLFDDDSQDKVQVLQLVNTLIDVAASVLTSVGQGQIAQFADEAKKVLEGITAALPDTRFMGSDTLVVRPNRTTVSETGQPKSVLTVRKLKNNGNVKFHYELRGIQVN